MNEPHKNLSATSLFEEINGIHRKHLEGAVLFSIVRVKETALRKCRLNVESKASMEDFTADWNC